MMGDVELFEKNEKEKCCFYLKSCEIEIISVILQPKKFKLITKGYSLGINIIKNEQSLDIK